MQQTKSKATLFVLIVATVIELYSEYFHLREVMFFTKPLILPLIAAYFFISSHNINDTVRKLMLGAFLFSWFGDVSLMLTPEVPADTELMGIPKSKYFFLAGLGSFLIAQLLFILSYRKATTPTPGKTKLAWFVPFVVYWIAMMILVLPPLSANTEKSAAVIPVMIYAGILISMAAVALTRYGRTNPKSFVLTLAGACVFVVSDSLIAVNFLAMQTPTQQAGFLIMSTYVVAELLIAQGVLEHY